MTRSLKTVALAVTAALSTTACQSPDRPAAEPRAAVDSAAVLSTLDSMRSLYEETVATGDFQRMATLLAEGALMVGPGGPAWDSLRTASDYPWPPGSTIDITPLEVRVLDEEWAYEFGTSVATYTPAGADQRRTLHDTYLVLFRNTPDGWKLFREVASPDLPPGVRPEP